MLTCTEKVARVKPVRNELNERPPRYRTLSPDGLPTIPRTFNFLEDAESHLREWVKRYARNGYYKTAECERIPFDEISSSDSSGVSPVHDLPP